MAVPIRAKLIVVLAALGGLATIAVGLASGPAPAGRGLVAAAVLCGMVIASWVWPLVMYRGDQSESVHLDEGFFVIMALVVRPSETIAAFAVATVVAQVVKRRPAIKKIFNCGQILCAVGLGLLADHAIAPPSHHLTVAQLGAAAVGTIVFATVNTCLLGAVIAATSDTPFVATISDGTQIRVLLVGACTVLGLMSALASSAYPWALPFVGLPFFVLRQVLSGHFAARHDRERLDGLFAATLAAHRSMGGGDVADALLSSAKRLLRCSDARLVAEQPASGLVAQLEVGDATHWLVVAGRSRTEPFDSADQALLDALAAVGAGALSNASLYEEGRYQRERLSTITSSLGEGVCAFDATGRITFVNPAAQAMLGWDEAELVEASDESASANGAVEFLVAPALRAMNRGQTVREDDITFRRADGSTLPVAFTCSPVIQAEKATGAVVVFRDITERKAFEERLAHHAFHDALTGLPNRRVFLDRLDHALQRSERNPTVHAVLFADVDRFKIVNDSLGHQAGDQLLQAISRRMAGALRPGDTLARFGGDEFTVLLEDIGSVEDAEALAIRVLDCLERPIALTGGHEVVARLSIGVALTTGRTAADDVLHDADAAMYEAKAHCVGGYKVFDAEAMGDRSVERVDLEAALRRAIKNKEMEVYFQPLFGTESCEIVGAEALVRWNHPERGVLSPAHFISLAEDTGLILPLGRQVLEDACRMARGWIDNRGRPLSITVNLSSRQFLDPSLVSEIRDVVLSSGIQPSQLCLEITESLAVADVRRTNETLAEIKALGVRVAIDDFGTGYSSLNYLKQFPANVVKIDQSFVKGLETSPVDSAIVAAVINLAKAIGMTTVAEGVETVEQLERLRSMGCPIVQGFLLARPMRGFELTALLEERRPAGHAAGVTLASLA